MIQKPDFGPVDVGETPFCDFQKLESRVLSKSWMILHDNDIVNNAWDSP